jgi:hypothetical protein
LIKAHPLALALNVGFFPARPINQQKQEEGALTNDIVAMMSAR